MSQHVDAIYENGVFRPQRPVQIANGERVSLTINPSHSAADDLADIADLLDTDFVEACRSRVGKTLSLEEVRRTLSAFTGSLSDRICEEREEQ